ncbi:PilZ domain-containing protein [Legionella waltersii]|uniref:Type 4 fimbrial biogenesis protein PilZ n=1 Tax=Legionella waltersii TaxID=66969 RepID=A0A0W1ALR4_9GAMM|nr:PilZ domain-containing protein [Legionella waltersii]KTD82299.1 type 4 fimbrial biogenesis protein PilZ [Legionella waltersii]SNV04177.1 type 4 fimbrial biogenesis protein PilZ [Legionella waltersii]
MTEKSLLINCSFPNEASLYMSYMPFIKGGGLFIRTNQVYPLGQMVDLSVNLVNEPEPYLVSGKVVWITPKGAQGNKPPGIGVQFLGESSRNLCNKIETYLAGMLKSTQLTDTI